MKDILSQAHDEDAFSTCLLDLANQTGSYGQKRTRPFLEILRDYKDDILSENIPNVVRAFIKIGDRLLDEDDDFISNEWLLWWSLRELLVELEPQERFELLRGAIEESVSISVSLFLVILLGREEGKYGASETTPEAGRLLTSDQIDVLEKVLLDKIREISQNPSLFIGTPRVTIVLNYWREWAGDSEVQEWVKEFTATDQGLLDFLTKFLFYQRVYSSSDVVAREHPKLDPKRVEPYLDIAQVIDRVKHLVDSPILVPKERIAVERLIAEYEMRQNGLDPDEILPNER